MAFPNNPTSPPVLELNSHAINTSCVGFWPLTEGRGDSAADISGNSNNATGTAVSWENSTAGNAYEGSGGYVQSASFPVTNVSAFSISAWIKNNATNADYLGTWSGFSGSTEKSVLLRNNVLEGIVRNAANTAEASLSSSSNLNTKSLESHNGMAHCVFVVDSGTATWYINGAQVAQNLSFMAGPYIPPSNTDGLLIGEGNGTAMTTGSVQNVRIFNTALSASDVALLYSRPWVGTDYDELWPYSPPVPSSMSLSTDAAATSLNVGLEGWWACTDASGTTLVDISGNGRDATLNGTNSWETDLVGTVNRFDNSSRTSHAETANTQPDLSSGYTFSTWVKHEEAGAASSPNYYGAGIVLGNSSGSSDVEIYYNYSNSTSQWPQVFHNRSNGGTVDAPIHTYPGGSGLKGNDNGVWVHYVVTSDGVNSKAYRNGVLYGTVGITNNPLSTSGYKLYINELPIVSSQSGLTCSMQNIRLYSRALTADEVTLLYERPWEGEATYGDALYNDPPPTLTLGTTAEDVAINTDCVSWWPLVEGTGTTANDIVGTNDGTITGAGWGDFPVGTGLSIGATNEYLQASVSSSVFQSAFTFSTWLKWDSTIEEASIIGVESGFGGSNYTSGEYIGIQKYNATNLRIHSGQGFSSSIPISVSTGDWVNIVWAFDPSTNISNVYTNGTSLGSVTLSEFNSPLGGIRFFGGANADVTSGHVLAGQNCRLWSRSLSAVEVQSLYETPWIGSNYGAVAAFYNYIFRSKRFRRL